MQPVASESLNSVIHGYTALENDNLHMHCFIRSSFLQIAMCRFNKAATVAYNTSRIVSASDHPCDQSYVGQSVA
jgi:hypothetical protein